MALAKAAEHSSHLLSVESLAAVGACAGVDRPEQARHVFRHAAVYGAVVNGAQRAQVGGYGVPTASAGAEADFETLQPFGGDVAKP